MLRIWPLLVLVFAIATGVFGQQAAQTPSAFETPEVPPQTPGLQAGSWDMAIIAGAYTESFGGGDEILAFAGVDVEYFALDRLAIFAEPLAYYVEQENPDAVGFGLNLGARYYFWDPVDDLSLFAEGGLGIIETEHRVPAPDGTHHNFVEQAGLGLRWRICDCIGILAGARYQHLSNASIHGSDRNPSIDAFGGYGGISIAF